MKLATRCGSAPNFTILRVLLLLPSFIAEFAIQFYSSG